MAKRSVAEQLGYTVDFTDRPDGRIDVKVTSAEGVVVLDRDALNRATGITMVSGWVRKQHPDHPLLTPKGRIKKTAEPVTAATTADELTQRADVLETAARDKRAEIEPMLIEIARMEREAAAFRQAAEVLAAASDNPVGLPTGPVVVTGVEASPAPAPTPAPVPV